MKKQVKKITKKILILSLATSLIFTSCFSHRKIEAQATAVTATLGALTLYEICLYFGSLALTSLGIGCVYENRDEIAEFGKKVIDSMTDIPTDSWLFGSYASDGSYVYGSEALQEVQDAQWTVIQGGGQSPKNDNDGDGDKDADDLTLELNLTGYFLLEQGKEFFFNTIKPMYDSWLNKENDSVLASEYGIVDSFHFDGTLPRNLSGYYTARAYFTFNDETKYYIFESDKPIGFEFYYDETLSEYILTWNTNGGMKSIYLNGTEVSTDRRAFFFPDEQVESNNFILYSNVPIFMDNSSLSTFVKDGIWDISKLYNYKTTLNHYRIPDWIKSEEDWKERLNTLLDDMRSLQHQFQLSQELASDFQKYEKSGAASIAHYNLYINYYVPMTEPVIYPDPYPSTSTREDVNPEELPNYNPETYPESDPNPDPDPDPDPVPDPDPGSDPSGGSGGDGGDTEIDLDGLGNIFSILFYLIMIIIMLIYLFLACLAFIVMIFRIPPSSSMLPEEMVMGFDHLKTIMIPGMNISIYGFAMALIYLLIVFTVIKILRLEINDFKFPRAGKKT